MATLFGGTGGDLLVGTAGSDLLRGLAGDDRLDGRGGTDTLDGGIGRDRAIVDARDMAAALAVFVLGPAFTTSIAGTQVLGVEDVTLLAGAGADRLTGAAGDDSLAGGGGGDALAGTDGDDTLAGEDGADTLLGGAGADLLDGGAGADALALVDAAAAGAGSTLAGMDTIRGFDPASGDRLWLRGQSAAGAILALDGPGLFALAGQPALPIGFGGSLAAAAAPREGLALPGGTGAAAFRLVWLPEEGAAGAGWALLDLDRDALLGAADLVLRIEFAAPGAGLDAAAFAPGSFALLGGDGADSLAGGDGAAAVLGFAGDDSLAGGAGNDSLLGDAGGDSLSGGAGFDTLRGGAGDDLAEGGAEADVLDGGAGDDSLAGGGGADLLLGGPGRDMLAGGEDNDTLQGEGGADTLLGGAGADLFVLQGAGDPGWSTPDAMALVADFTRLAGDRLRIGTAGSVANAGTLLGADGLLRPLVWSGTTEAAAMVAPGLRLPAQALPGLNAIQVFAVPAPDGSTVWLVLDIDGDGLLGLADTVLRFDGVAAIGPEDLVPGSFLRFAAAAAPAGSPDGDLLAGTALSEGFLGTEGRDAIDGGGGAPNTISYAGLAGPIAYAVLGEALGYGIVTKPDGNFDLLRDVQGIAGSAAADRLDGTLAPAQAVYALSLEGREGADLIIGNGARSVQASYAASPAAARIDLGLGRAQDGWGGIDQLVNIRRVAVTSAFDDTVLGSAGDDLFLSGASGSKSFDGRGGQDEYRYAGSGAVSIMLAEEILGLFRLPPRAEKPGGTDTLAGIAAASGGAGDDRLRGGAAAERFAGGPGHDSIDGGEGLDTVAYDLLSTAAGLALHGVTVDLGAGTATDGWDGMDSLAGIENAWGSGLADLLIGRAIAGTPTYLRGLAGDDTLRAPGPGTLVAADYAGDPGAIEADLHAGTVRDGWGGIDRLVDIAAIRGADCADTILGSMRAERIEGGAGDDSLAGGGGRDTLIGGAGNDLYVVDDPAALVVEAAGEGDDTILASVAMILPAGVEWARVAAGGGPQGQGLPPGIELQGQDLANIIAGGDGPDRLLGWGGDDSLAGGPGSDSLLGNVGADSLAAEEGADRALGGPGNDALLGGDGNDTLYGEDGDDSLSGEAGEDQVVGGTGQDSLEGGPGNDSLWGQAGDDSLSGGSGTEWLLGGEGNDRLDGAEGNDILYGETGDDSLAGAAGTDFLSGGYGADLLDGGAEPDSLRGDLGNDRLAGGPGNDFLYGGLGEDTLQGDDGVDTLWAEDGNDLLAGGEGDDWLLGGAGDDSVLGGDGVDNLWGHDGSDTLDGGAGSGWIRGGTGDDSLRGGAAIDNFWGEAGNDTIDGGASADNMNGGAGDDLYLVDNPGDLVFELAGGGTDSVVAAVAINLAPHAEILRLLDSAGDADSFGNLLDNAMTGNAGANRLFGGFGADTLAGGGGADLLNGGDHDDRLLGEGGADSLIGGNGEDRLEGGAGADTLRGDAGADLYVFGAGDGADRVQGYTPGLDRILLRGVAAEALPGLLAAAREEAGATVLDLGAGDMLTLEGVARASLGVADLLV